MRIGYENLEILPKKRQQMKEKHFKRYQLNKKTSIQIKAGHPWVFSGNVSSATAGFKNGELLKLFDGNNNVVGFGIFSQSGRIAIRVFHYGNKISQDHFLQRLKTLWKKKKSLLVETNAIRLVNGESDHIPGIAVDIYHNVCVIQYYSDSVYKLARLVSLLLPKAIPTAYCQHIVLRKAKKSGEQTTLVNRVLRGEAPQNIVINELELKYQIDVINGQKTGFFLDLRGVRRVLHQIDFTNAKVLNLFSGTGALSIIMQKQGAKHITSVEQSKSAQKLHQQNLQLNNLDCQKDLLVCADVFQFLQEQNEEAEFDFIIIDPPSLAATQKSLPLALKKIEQLHEMALKKLKPNSEWLSLCCTERISREDFIKAVGRASKKNIGKGNTKIIRELSPELDHQPNKNFPEGNYLKQVFFQN